MKMEQQNGVKAKLEDGHERFIFAGNAYFSLKSLKTGTHYTYRVSRAFDEKKDAESGEVTKIYKDLWFVSLLTGPDNWENYTYIGICDANHDFKTTAKSRLPREAAPIQGFIYTIRNLRETGTPGGVEVWHSGKCGRCGRMLTVPESVASGFGPECIGKL